jgi:farnesyl-diphosphate farnesyltransferase
MRAIDEIEDHPKLDGATKASLLQAVSLSLQATPSAEDTPDLPVLAAESALPEVSVRLGEWLRLAPRTIAARVCGATAAMAERMAYWAKSGWRVHSEADLNCYTFSVAGAVGLLLSDLWAWHDGTQTHRGHAVGFGRGLQAVNILRNRESDLARGVDFFPDGWAEARMFAYARGNLTLADAYLHALPEGPARDFCTIPLKLAHATLEALERGEAKLSRSAVLQLTRDDDA